MEGERVADSLRNQVFSEKPGFSPGFSPDEVIQFTQAIIRQPSVTGEEGALGRFLAHALEEFGLRVELAGGGGGPVQRVGRSPWRRS